MDNDPIKSELSLTARGASTSIPDVPREVLSALIESVIGARESVEQRRRLPALVAASDFEQLVYRLQQWIDQYEPVSTNLTISVFSKSNDDFSGITRSDFTNIESFLRSSPASGDVTTSVTVNFTFVARHESTGKIIQCQLVAEFKSTVRRLLYDYSKDNPLGGNRYYSESNGWTAKFKILYTDIMVAKGLLGVVDTWYRSLERAKISSFSRAATTLLSARSFEFRNTGIIAWGVVYVPLFFGSSTGLLANMFDLSLRMTIASSLISAATASGLLFWSLNKVDPDDDSRLQLIRITPSDEKRFARLLKDDEDRALQYDFWGKTVMAGFAVSILASVVVGFFS